jgi:hypothetical protein
MTKPLTRAEWRRKRQTRKSVCVGVKIDESTFHALLVAAQRDRRLPSAFCRVILETYLEHLARKDRRLAKREAPSPAADIQVQA